LFQAAGSSRRAPDPTRIVFRSANTNFEIELQRVLQDEHDGSDRL